MIFEHNLLTILQTNFHSALEDTSQLWIIEFYASWCGHCQHFAPVIRKWSDDIQNWGRMVSIGVIDCGDNQNHEICTSNNINGKMNDIQTPPNGIKQVFQQ